MQISRVNGIVTSPYLLTIMFTITEMIIKKAEKTAELLKDTFGFSIAKYAPSETQSIPICKVFFKTMGKYVL